VQLSYLRLARYNESVDGQGFRMTDATSNGSDAALARAKMVDSQVRPNQVNDRRVIAAMREIPREAFVPAGAQAYTDADIALGNGRYMAAPMLIGRLAQLVMANNPAHVLVVGAASGYSAAVLAKCGAHVIALEEDGRLASAALGRFAPSVERVGGKLAAGWPAGGPYDAIFINGAVDRIPAVFAAQLAPAGRIVTVLADGPRPPGLGRAVIAQPAGTGFAVAKMFDCAARVIPAFQHAPEFEF
jgi:protein-L-isoaspartate(D-aspartate) O-methyltransferase